jgi:3'-phosphoadenosine 5'-phosphosulfate (PAPS) 3'-phosphatase
MKRPGYDLSLILSALVLVGLVGCKQETPAEKAKAAAAGNAVTEAAGQAAVDYMKTPMDKARQAEGKLEKSAEQTAAEIKKSTQ